MNQKHTLFTLALAGVTLLAGCGKDDADDKRPVAPEVKTVTGETKTVGGNGKIETWARTTDGRVDQVTISFDQAAFIALTSDTAMSMNMLNFPAIVKEQTGVTMGTIDWNPGGHPPMPIYAAPHFDFHFFMKDHAAIMAIPGGPDSTAVNPSYIPANYVFGPPGTPAMSVPQMGVHYTDMTSPEFNGQAFTKTFIYGFSHGDLVFLEPMVSKAYLQTHPNITIDIKQPGAYQRTGISYPTKYTIEHNMEANKYHIMLEGFVQR